MANLSPLVFYPRFAHVTEQIFEQLDQKSLSNCKEVSKSWKEIIDHKNLPWIQIVNLPKILQNGETYLHHAAKTGQSEVFVKILEGETVKNPKNNSDTTPFHHVCFHGHLKIAKMLVHRSTDFNIDLNAKDKNNKTEYPFSPHCRQILFLLQM